MKSALFVFIGVTENDSNASLDELEILLKGAHPHIPNPIKYSVKENILIITLSNPHFVYYVSLVKNDSETFNAFVKLAKDFELPWDMKPVNKERLFRIFTRIKKEDWFGIEPYSSVGFAILEEMEKFKSIKVFTIPSCGRSTFVDRILSKVKF